MTQENLYQLAESRNLILARGVLGVVNIVEADNEIYIATVPFHVIAEYSFEHKKYVKLNRPYTVYTYFCEPSFNTFVEIPNHAGVREIFSMETVNRVKSFLDYISHVLLLYDETTKESTLQVGSAFYAFVSKLPFSEEKEINSVYKRWFSRNIFVEDDTFLSIQPLAVSSPTEESTNFAKGKDDETKEQRVKLVNLHVRHAKMSFDVRQKVVAKSESRNEKHGFDWD